MALCLGRSDGCYKTLNTSVNTGANNSTLTSEAQITFSNWNVTFFKPFPFIRRRMPGRAHSRLNSDLFTLHVELLCGTGGYFDLAGED